MLPLVELDRIDVHLGGEHVLREITWSLAPGRHWAFVGPNGSGKSTLLRVVAGLQWIDHGGGSRRYSPDGVTRDAVARARTWIRHVAAEQHERYARLDLPLPGRSVIASGIDDTLYVARPLDAAEESRVDALVTEFGLTAFADRPVRELSSGQIRRLLIARALAGRPRAIVLDESTNGLDRDARRDVLAALDRLAASAALVVATHRLDDLPAATTDTALLRHGRIVEAGPGRPRSRPRRTAAHRRTGDPSGAPVLLRLRDADVYRGSTRVLHAVDWELRAGEHTLVRGANGAGKSTFAGVIAGTVAPATGAHVERFGRTGPFDVWQLKARVAHVSDELQTAYDLAESVESVVASGFPSSIGLFAPVTGEQRRTVDGVLTRLGLSDLRERTFTRLSFGERRKVLVARSLVRRPEIFVLDEVWNGLDADFRRALHAELDALAAAGTTIVAFAHDEDDDIVAFARRVCRIEAGRLVVVA